MTSERRKQASQANGAKSQGPKTPEGKRRSSLNALKHGLLSDRVVLESESPEEFQTLLDQHTDRFDPKDGVERGFIEEMVAANWRLRRLWAIETSLLDEAFSADPEGQSIGAAFSQLAEGPGLALLHRYETRLHMMYQRALRNLLLLRDAAKPEESTPSVLEVRWVDSRSEDTASPSPEPPVPPAQPANPVPAEPAPLSSAGAVAEAPSAPPADSQPPVPAAVRNEPNPISGQSDPGPSQPLTGHRHPASGIQNLTPDSEGAEDLAA